MKHPLPHCVAIALALTALAPPARAAECEGELLAMGGIPVKLQADGIDPAACRPVMEGITAELRVLERVMSAHTPEGAVAAINRGADTGGPCPAALREVIQTSQKVSQDTGGAFDITVGPLVRMWKQAGKAGRLPTDEERTEALALVGHEAVVVAGDRLRLDRTGARIDLGGIAKGYFGDVAVARMREAGATRCIADVGLDLVTWRTEGQPEFTIGVRNPWGEGLMGVLTAGDGAVVTSGDYERFVTIDGKPYSHIVDPRTGQPVQGMRSVTVLTAEADALATALFVMGYEAGAAHVEGRDDVEAILVGDHDGSPDRQQVFISAGLVERFQWSEDVLSR